MKRKFIYKLMHKDHYPFFERIFYRPVAAVLVPVVAQITRSPTFLNLLGFLIGGGGMILIAFGDYWQRILGALILIISYIFDCLDGMLARGFQKESRFGALIDTTLDSFKESLIFLALAWTYYLQTADYNILLYLVMVIFLQRMFGRTLPWYYFLYNKDVFSIKENFLNKLPLLLRLPAIFFSEAYRSGTIWIIVLIGVVTNQIIITFIYFIVVILALFLFLIYQAYQEGK